MGKPVIVIIDDDPNLRKTLSDILRAKGYEPLSAGDGQEALGLMQQYPVDLALVDLKLPDISGLEVLERIRADHPHTEAIVLTGNASLDSAIEATNKGAFSYLQKPYDIDQLLLHIRRAIEKRQAEERIRQYQENLEERIRERTAELELANQLLNKTKDRLQFLVSESPAAIYTCKTSGDFGATFISDNIKKQLGYEPAEFIENTTFWADHIHPEDRQRVLDELGHLFETGHHGHEYRFLHKDGTYRWMHDEMRLVWDRKSSSDQIIGSWIDITELKHAEQVIKKLNENLKQRIAELEEARTLAEAGVKARSSFLANISHELVTPLNSIIGFSQILLDGLGGPMNEQQKDYAASILQGGNRLHETLKEIVQFAGLESGEMKLQTDRFLFKDLMKASLLAFNEKAAVQGVALSLEIGLPPETEIEADRGKLQQVMFNLLDNAVKFTPAGGSVHVHARSVRRSAFGVGSEGESSESGVRGDHPPLSPPVKGGESPLHRAGEGEGEGALVAEHRTLNAELDADFIEISVADTGIGIQEEDLARIFQTFEQLESPYTKQYKGTGLGLMLAKKIIDLHGGRIWVRSEIGKGSTFTFVIPAGQGNRSAQGVRRSEL